ncbi:MAG: hypothetical protein ACOX0Y_03010 [Thiopseudomonas sp.]
MRTNIALYQALVSIDISEERAQAVIDALEADMLNQLATKADLNSLELRLTIRMGVMFSAAVGVIIAAMRFMA